MTIALSGILGLAIAILLRHRIPPFAIGFFWIFFCMLMIALRLRAIPRAVFYNLAFVFLALSLFEIYQTVRETRDARVARDARMAIGYGEQYPPYLVDDKDLGWAIARQNRVTRDLRIGAGGSVIWDAIYSLNDGVRRGGLSQSRTTIWFAGCSFTFGVGVSDADTLSNQFARKSGLRAINLGVGGWGPHQMLRILELDRPTLFNLQRPAAVVYTALPDHIRRAAGLTTYLRHGPLYNVIDGDLKLMGPFEPVPSFFENQLLIWSRTYREVYRSIRRARAQAPTTEGDRERFLAIVERSKKIIAQKYGVKLVVVLWDEEATDFESDWIAKHLSEKGIPLFRVSTELPQLKESKYHIPNDGHPNADGYGLVAEALVKFLPAYLGRPSEASDTGGLISSQERHAR